MDSVILQQSTLLIFALATPTFALLFAFPFRRHLPWKTLDVAALLIGATALVAPISAGQRAVAEVQLGPEIGWLAGDAATLNIFIHTWGSCPTYTRSEWSPANFDELVRESQLVCDWATRFKPVIETLGPNDIRKIDERWIEEFPELNNETAGFSRNEVFEQIRAWNAHVDHIEALRARASVGIPPEYLIFAPYLLIIALALSLVSKVYKPA